MCWPLTPTWSRRTRPSRASLRQPSATTATSSATPMRPAWLLPPEPSRPRLTDEDRYAPLLLPRPGPCPRAPSLFGGRGRGRCRPADPRLPVDERARLGLGELRHGGIDPPPDRCRAGDPVRHRWDRLAELDRRGEAARGTREAPQRLRPLPR